MPEAPAYVVEARVVSVQQVDLSKTASARNLYSHIELDLLRATPKLPSGPALAPQRCTIKRPAQEGDMELKGKEVKLEIAVDDPQSPRHFYWLKRLD